MLSIAIAIAIAIAAVAGFLLGLVESSPWLVVALSAAGLTVCYLADFSVLTSLIAWASFQVFYILGFAVMCGLKEALMSLQEFFAGLVRKALGRGTA